MTGHDHPARFAYGRAPYEFAANRQVEDSEGDPLLSCARLHRNAMARMAESVRLWLRNVIRVQGVSVAAEKAMSRTKHSQSRIRNDLTSRVCRAFPMDRHCSYD
jgi:hypothetical protein